MMLVPLFMWLFFILVATIKSLTGMYDFPLVALLIISISALSVTIGYKIGWRIGSRPYAPQGEPAPRADWVRFVPHATTLLLIFFFSGELLLLKYVGSTEGMTLAEIRRFRSETVEVGVPTIVLYANYLSNMCGFLATFSVFAVIRRRSWYALWTVAALVYAYASAKISGGRFPVMTLGLFASAVWLTENWVKIRARWFRYLSVAFLVVCLLAGFNVLFNTLRFEGGTVGREVFLYESDGQELLSQFGNNRPSPVTAYTVGILDEYLGKAIFYLDVYVRYENLEPAMGRYNNRFAWRRFSDFDWFVLKDSVDEVLQVIGVNYNVWATGLRDVWVDYGIGTPVFAVGFIGFLWGAAHAQSRFNLGAKFLFNLLFGWLLGSPLFSIWRMTGYELAGYFAVLAWIALAVSTKKVGLGSNGPV